MCYFERNQKTYSLLYQYFDCAQTDSLLQLLTL